MHCRLRYWMNHHFISLLYLILFTKNVASFSLPPTPPSSTSSDSEGSLSPERDAASPKLEETSGGEIGTRRLNQAGRVLLTTKPLPDSFGSGSSRHPINSPLISYQPVMSQHKKTKKIFIGGKNSKHFLINDHFNINRKVQREYSSWLRRRKELYCLKVIQCRHGCRSRKPKRNPWKKSVVKLKTKFQLKNRAGKRKNIWTRLK